METRCSSSRLTVTLQLFRGLDNRQQRPCRAAERPQVRCMAPLPVAPRPGPAAAARRRPTEAGTRAVALSPLVPDYEKFDLPLGNASQRLHLLPPGPWIEVAGGVCAPAGFAAQGLFAGLRQDSRRADVALLASDRLAAAAGCTSDTASAVLLVAEAGDSALLQTCREEAGASLGVDAATVLVQACRSAERPGDGLDRVLAAVPQLAAQLEGGAEAAHHAACVVCEEDTTTKEAALEVSLGGSGTVRLGGMAHASPGGLQAVITCDAVVEPAAWRAMFDRGAAASCGLMALPTSAAAAEGAIVGLANGAAHNTPLIRDASGSAAQCLESALTALLEGLAKAVARDVPDTHCLVEVEVSGADSRAEARRVALAVARSRAMRSAVGRCSPEVWTPVCNAISASGVPFEPTALRICVGGMPLLHHGRPTPSLASALGYCSEYLHLAAGKHSQVRIDVRLGGGQHSARAWTPDRT